MALDRLTKIDGGGISTTSDYRVGIITASKFVGPFDGTGGNFSGIITATGANFSGNVTIGGTLTYEDVTNIDSVGLITARDGIFIPDSQKIEIGHLAGNPDLTINSMPTLEQVSIDYNRTGAGRAFRIRSTFTQFENWNGLTPIAKFIGGVGAGHVELNYAGNKKFETTTKGIQVGTGVTIETNGQANFAGITTFSDAVNVALGKKINFGNINGTNGHIYYDGSTTRFQTNSGLNIGSPVISLKSANLGEVMLEAAYNGAVKLWYDYSTYNTPKLQTTATGVTIDGTAVAGGLDINGNVDISGHTYMGDTTIAGVTTFVSSGAPAVKIVQSALNTNAEMDINATNGGQARLNLRTSKSGTNRAARIDFFNQHSSTTPIWTLISDYDQNATNDFRLVHYNEKAIVAQPDGAVELYNDGTKQCETYSSGLDIVPGKKLRLTHANATDGNDGTISSGVFAEGLTFVGTQTVSGNGRQITHYGNIKPSNNNQTSLGSSSNQYGYLHSIRLIARYDSNTTGLYIGASDDIRGYHDGTDSWLTNKTGNFRIGNTHNDEIKFLTQNNTRWNIDGSGHFVPDTAGAVNIGSASAEIGNVYLADSKNIYIGSDQDVYFNHSGVHAQIKNTTGNFYFDTELAHYIRLGSGNEAAITATHNSSVDLYYDGGTYTTPKLKTSATGITVDGEVAASQDYPNIRPVLDFNFAAEKKLDPRITYRRTGPASFVNEFGKVVIVGDNAPRFDHDPITRESKGLLLEEARTNFMKYSDEFAIDNGLTGGNWDAIGGESQWTRVSDTTETKDPTGITNHASKLTHNSGNVLRGYWYSGAANGAVNKTFSVYLKKATTDATNVTIDIGDTNITTFTITDEWKRYSVTTSSGGNGNFVDLAATHNKAFYAWGAQIEAGSFVTSYIPTSSAAVTRGADLAEIDGEDFTDFFNQTEGTINCAYWLGNDNAGMRVFQINDGANSAIDIVAGSGSGTGGYGYVNTGGVAQATVGQSSTNANYLNKLHVVTLTYKENDIAGINKNTGVLTTDTSATLDGAYNQVTFYQHTNSGDQLNGHLQRVQYYPKRLPDNQLKNLNNQ